MYLNSTKRQNILNLFIDLMNWLEMTIAQISIYANEHTYQKTGKPCIEDKNGCICDICKYSLQHGSGF